MAAVADIVVGIGLTGESGYVLEKVVGLAGDPSRVAAIHVLDNPTVSLGHIEGVESSPTVEQQIEANATARMDRLCRRFGVTNFNVLRGYPATELHHAAEQLDAGLIAVGTHGRHGWRRLLGDTANAVLHGTTRNVLAILTRDDLPTVTTSYSRIVVAVDMSPESSEVLEVAQRIKARYDAELFLLTVLNPVSQLLTTLGLSKYSNGVSIDDEVKQQLDTRIQELATTAQIPESQAWVRIGSPAEEIQSFAEETKADLVILGTHGTRGPVSLFGTLSTDLLHGADQDILAVRVGE